MTPSHFEKPCKDCGEVRPLDEFYKHPAMRDGHLNSCKQCACAKVRKHRRENDHVRDYDRTRRKGKAQTGRTRSFRKKHPLAYRAHNAVNNAVRDGRMTKEPCLFCGSTERLEGHHRDYRKPLDVVWLCARCHKRLHATFPETAAHEKGAEV